MSEKPDVLLALYLDNIQYARHHENLRSTMSNLILVVGAALGAVITMDNKINSMDLPFIGFLVIIGLYGTFFSFRHFERFHSQYARARKLRAQLELAVDISISDMNKMADKEHAIRFPISHKWSLSYFWAAIPLSIALLGVALFVVWIVQ